MGRVWEPRVSSLAQPWPLRPPGSTWCSSSLLGLSFPISFMGLLPALNLDCEIGEVTHGTVL